MGEAMSHPIPTCELRASDALRVAWLAWMGRTGTREVVALAAIGWTSKRPKWISDGNIPDAWRCRIARQIGQAA